MPTLDHDLLLKLDPLDHSALLAARIAERDAAIVAKDHARREARAVVTDGAGAKSVTDAAAAKTATLATAATHEATIATKVAEVKVKHAATDFVAADEGHAISLGAYIMYAEPRLAGFGPIEDRRLKLDDDECDAWVASYRVSVRAHFEAMDLQRQIGEYETAHPKIDGEPGRLIPEPQELQDLRASLADRQKTGDEEKAAQAAICAKVYEREGVKREEYSYFREIDPATGEIVLGRNPALTKHDQVVIEAPVGGLGKVE